MLHLVRGCDIYIYVFGANSTLSDDFSRPNFALKVVLQCMSETKTVASVGFEKNEE